MTDNPTFQEIDYDKIDHYKEMADQKKTDQERKTETIHAYEIKEDTPVRIKKIGHMAIVGDKGRSEIKEVAFITSANQEINERYFVINETNKNLSRLKMRYLY